MSYKEWYVALHFSMDLSSVFGKKNGGLKKESESLIFTGLKILVEY